MLDGSMTAYRSPISTVSSSSHAVAKCSMLTTIWAICERFDMAFRREMICALTWAVKRSSRDYAVSLSRCSWAYLAQHLVNVDVLLVHTIGKLIELVDKVANIDTTHGVRLGEGHRLGEALPASGRQLMRTRQKDADIARDSASPVASQHTPET